MNHLAFSTWGASTKLGQQDQAMRGLSENMVFKKNGFMVMFRIGIAIARVIPHFRTNYSMGIYLIFVHSDRQTFTRVMNSFLGFSSIWKMRDIS